MHRITCYKLCYLLGVAPQKLAEDFVLEHRIAGRSDYFVRTYTMKRVRALSGVFFFVLKNYQECLDNVSFLEKASAEIAQLSIETGYNPVAEKGEQPLSKYLQGVVEEQHELLHCAWEDSNLALSFEQFELIARLPDVTEKSLPILLFLHQKTDHMYGMYFYGRECLSVSFGAMLRDDLALRDRLSLYYGKRLPSLGDRTPFAKALEAYSNAAFTTPETLFKNHRVICVNQKDKKLPEKFTTAFAGRPVTFVEPDCVDWGSIGPRDCLVCPDSRWIADSCVEHPNVKFGAILPVESRYYNQWRKRKYENIVLVGH